MKREGVLYVISAPSGAGKTSLCKEIIDIFPNLRHSVSYTTRPPRNGEVHGRDYFFVGKEEFDRMVEAGEFAEWAEVHGNFYGTSLATLKESRSEGIDLILDIDCQGARQLKGRFEGGVYVFVLPPSIEELRRRLDNRSSDSQDVIERRIHNAAGEIKEARWYDYIIVNDKFSVALDQLKSVLIAEQCRTTRLLQGLSRIFTI
ncbi:guanylate kinase [Geomonas sp. Red69]|uniref:Guanylate kinase n=1 Tax=Geomonas diazotrophica TaxID=2843197 RepID=A0ABX8JJ75_9BACT|nr:MULTISPECIES: guanylate kinase [Geomonas]MBU5636756.1 guanylate kinase [Geomonas diazotrophica]QWV98434.1 guanylate kinase [Geomonas nitrogeniifigens]QXE87616.1 guanylate kinase [Geomonas nitrogeniifigens]